MLAKPTQAAQVNWLCLMLVEKSIKLRAVIARHQQNIPSMGSTAKAAGKAKPNAMDVVAHPLEAVNMESSASAAIVLLAMTIKPHSDKALFDFHAGNADAVAKDTAIASTAIVKEYADDPQMVTQFRPSCTSSRPTEVAESAIVASEIQRFVRSVIASLPCVERLGWTLAEYTSFPQVRPVEWFAS